MASTRLNARESVGARQQSFACCGVRIDPADLDAAVGRLQSLAFSGEGGTVHLCNAYTLSLARRDPGYTELLNRSDLNLPDGMPLVWLGRRLGFSIADDNRPRGCDVFLTTVDQGRSWGLRHYLYGATPEVVEALAATLHDLCPGTEIVGVESPPFRPLTTDEESALVERVRAVAPHIVWVGIGTPRQDVFVDTFSQRLGVTCVAVGAAFDFIAGAKQEAPTWMRRNGVEWLYRLASEPRRLWRRYLVGNAVFLSGVVRDGVSLVESG